MIQPSIPAIEISLFEENKKCCWFRDYFINSNNMLRLILFAILLSSFSITCPAQRRPGQKKAIPFENLSEFEKYIKKQEAGKLFSGTILIAKKDQIIHRAAYGLANFKTNKKNRPHTKINIGSLNKAFTSVCVLKLVEQGKISLADKITLYIPELSMKHAEEITIKHLLQMTSGLGSYFEVPAFQKSYRQLKNMEAYLPIIKDLELSFKPGEGRRYSNAGYELLGILVQRVSKMNYFDFVEKHVYKVAGMKNTNAYERDQKTPNLAQGYTQYREGDFLGSELPEDQKNKFIMNVNDRHAIKGTAAGGGFSTADDLYAFTQALNGNKLLSKELTDLIFNRFEEKPKRNSSYRVGGGSVGINAMILADFAKEHTIIVLSNFDPPTASDLAARIDKSLQEGKF